jgi:hypothetical protein
VGKKNSRKSGDGFLSKCATAVFLGILMISVSSFFGCAGIPAKAPGLEAPRKSPNILPYEYVITKNAKSDEGLFTVHIIGEKLFYEIPNDMLDKEMLIESRSAKTATNIGYGGEQTNTQVVRWQRFGDKVLLRIVTYENVANENLPVYQAVRNSNFEPVVAAFYIKAYGKNNESVVIETTDLFTKDVPFMGLSKRRKEAYKVRMMDPKRSMIVSAKSYPLNIEVRNIITYDAIEPPDNDSTGTISIEMNHSMILLPQKPMTPRLYDERVSYFSIEQNDFGTDAQKAEKKKYIIRWRLEPKDVEAFKRGELVEPVKPIVYYLDPATPEVWRKYIKDGVEKWQPAFEAIGFKNAIVCKYPPSATEDPEFSPEDVRYSVIRWFSSEIENAFGPHVHDPRTGEILESDISIFHNILNLQRDWYFVQTAAANPEARAPKFANDVMGKLLQYAVTHEVGHTLGLPHNMKASATYPVEKLRSPEFTSKMGTTPSIMDYARFNYIAQPGDGVTNFIPVVGVYDYYSIKIGYKPIFEAKTPEEEKPVINQWIVEKYDDPMYRFNDLSTIDPTSQCECIGDDPVNASEYGVANLKIVLNNLIKWSYVPLSDYSGLQELYCELINQWGRYMGHVVTEIGGVVKTRKNTDQEGVVFVIVPKKKQHEAMDFLVKQAINTPEWWLNKDVLDRIEGTGTVERIRIAQVNVINNILDPARMQRLIEHETRLGADAYTLGEMLADLRDGVWSELKKSATINIYRRNMQRGYLDRMEWLMTQEPAPVPPFFRQFIDTTDVLVGESDIRPYVRGELEILKADIKIALPGLRDKGTTYHLKDALVRIENILKPKKD